VSAVLVVVPAGPDGLPRADGGTLALARTLAAGAPLHLVTDGTADPVLLDTTGRHGAAGVHTLTGDAFASFAPAALAVAALGLREDLDAHVLVATGDERGAEVMAHVAARADLPLAAGCTRVEPTADGWSLTRIRWGGVLLEDAVLRADVGLFTVVPHQVDDAPADQPSVPEVHERSPEVPDDAVLARVVETATSDTGVSLATAPVVISGGRGVGGAEGFAVLEELAGLLGGAVGCSRVATNNGWRSHNDQVGQTGTRVAPDLYVACGISGATQHWVGCMNAKRILAINTDADAPMVTRAHDAVIGDLHEILPAVVAAVRARTGR
jgi:electron transfer flavoprotein alpha subunit